MIVRLSEVFFNLGILILYLKITLLNNFHNTREESFQEASKRADLMLMGRRKESSIFNQDWVLPWFQEFNNISNKIRILKTTGKFLIIKLQRRGELCLARGFFFWSYFQIWAKVSLLFDQTLTTFWLAPWIFNFSREIS